MLRKEHRLDSNEKEAKSRAHMYLYEKCSHQMSECVDQMEMRCFMCCLQVADGLYAVRISMQMNSSKLTGILLLNFPGNIQPHKPLNDRLLLVCLWCFYGSRNDDVCAFVLFNEKKRYMLIEKRLQWIHNTNKRAQRHAPKIWNRSAHALESPI